MPPDLKFQERRASPQQVLRPDFADPKVVRPAGVDPRVGRYLHPEFAIELVAAMRSIKIRE